MTGCVSHSCAAGDCRASPVCSECDSPGTDSSIKSDTADVPEAVEEIERDVASIRVVGVKGAAAVAIAVPSQRTTFRRAADRVAPAGGVVDIDRCVARLNGSCETSIHGHRMASHMKRMNQLAIGIVRIKADGIQILFCHVKRIDRQVISLCRRHLNASLRSNVKLSISRRIQRQSRRLIAG